MPLYYSDSDHAALKSLYTLLQSSKKVVSFYLDGYIYKFDTLEQMKMFAEGINCFFILNLDE